MADATNFWKDGEPYAEIGGNGSGSFYRDGETFSDTNVVGNNITGLAGIPSEEAFGGDGVVNAQSIGGLTGIPSGETFGTGGHIDLSVIGSTGIPSGEAFGGDGSVANIVGVTGIPSGEAFGTGGFVQGQIFGSAGIPSGEVFGDGSSLPAGVSLVLSSGVNGIASGEAFGTGGVLQFSIAGLIGIPSAEAFGGGGTVLALDPEVSLFGVYINSQPRTSWVRTGGIKIDEQLNFNSTATLNLYDEPNTYGPEVGEEVVVLFWVESLSSWERIFAGSVESVQRRKTPRPDRQDTYYEVRCVDYARALSRRRVSQKFSQASFGTLTAILTWFNTHFFVPEGITWVDRGDPGIVIPDIEFSGTPLNECMGTLAELVNWDWAIDYYRNFYFYDRPAYTMDAPYDITEDTMGPNGEVWFDLEVKTDRGLYRNSQLVKSSQVATTTAIVEEYTVPINDQQPPNPFFRYWDGILLNDTTYAGRVASIQKISVNGVEVPFYVQRFTGGVPGTPPADWRFMQIWGEDMQLIWNMIGYPGGNPTTGSVLRVEFEVNNALPEPLRVQNTAEIAARQAIEGGTGLYEDVYDAGDITDEQTLLELAQQLLARFSEMGKEVSLGTDKYGWMTGQQVGVNLPTRGISSTIYTIEGVTKEEIAKKLLRYRLRVSNRIQQRDALTAMDRLVKRIRKPSKQVNDNIQWELATTVPGFANPGLFVANNAGGPYIVRSTVTLKNLAIYFLTPPTGDSIILDILRNGTSIFPVGFVCEYRPTDSLVTFSQFANAPLTLEKDDILTLNILQVGSSTPGQDGKVTLNGWA